MSGAVASGTLVADTELMQAIEIHDSPPAQYPEWDVEPVRIFIPVGVLALAD